MSFAALLVATALAGASGTQNIHPAAMATTIRAAATMPVIRAPIAFRTAIAPTILPSTDDTTIPTKEGAVVATEAAAPAVFRSRADLPTGWRKL